ncbi:MAG: EamA family transporter [Crocinitomicaceae bacterium]|nr:EamA family transporter [Crocinitomicaceae bacterium]
MLDLILGILFFNIILIIFKLFERFKVDNIQAIVVNYVVASSLGIPFSGIENPIAHIAASDWVWFALIIGFFFVVVFNFLATGAQKVGIAISTVANKMSVIIPVIFALIVFGETVSFLKIFGVVLALIGVFMTSTTGKKLSFDKQYIWLIIIIFAGQGIADCIFNYAQRFYVEDYEGKLFTSTMFLAACVTGLAMIIPRYINGKSKFEAKNILWGVILSVPNFLTVYFFFQALESDFMEASQIYPILNMGVIVLSALTGWIIFREKLTVTNWMGILVSILAIASITFG